MQPEALPDLPGQFTLYLARHATPDRTRFDIPYHYPPGPELTENGKQEASELGCFMRGVGVKKIQASPLERAWRTALIAQEVCGAALEMNPDLAEWRPEEVEKVVLERMLHAFEAGAKMAEHHPVALVTHGGPIMALLKYLGLPADTVERYRIFDGRNLISVAGAWRVEKTAGEIRLNLVFAPAGIKLPEGMAS